MRKEDFFRELQRIGIIRTKEEYEHLLINCTKEHLLKNRVTKRNLGGYRQ